jgi:2-methylcitrate dehydratase PrpD
MADTLAQRFAHFATALRYEDLPPAVLDKAKACILHWLLLTYTCRPRCVTRRSGAPAVPAR